MVLLAAGLLTSVARGATPPDVTGAWISVASPSAPAYELVASPGGGTLSASWRGSQTHSNLFGSFTGTLSASGDAYSGTFHVSELGNNVTGTMTFTIESASSTRPAGRLVAKSGSLRALIRVSLNRSPGLPPLTTVGTVTFYKATH